MASPEEIEREAVVRWLREEERLRLRLAYDATDDGARNYNFTRGFTIAMAADAIERGDHLKPGDSNA